MEHFSKYKIEKNDLKHLLSYESRDGFELIEKDDFESMLEYFVQYEIYANLIPILTDNNSNYWCLYVGGKLKGTVCHLSHDEVNLEPKFKNITKLINTIEKNPEAYDFSELDVQVFDYPKRENEIDLDNREEIITELLTEFEQVSENKEDLRQQLAFSVIALVKSKEIESYVYPLLDDEDMYIQERAIEIIGFHKYEPARNKLIELTKTAMSNGKSAAGKVLKELNKNKYSS
ncbi:HEAT repeat domain-containing protein [uncultured Aquimarina sp.]|uniref:HEAT repeat domain-containing protein n=1 Tax=uncultured Aquimarina sp. TaxID=575652 RepID=UPI00260CBC85|nr:HEAT repeat domain-containing protein [uncultured Aquimarina sp.]